MFLVYVIPCAYFFSVALLEFRINFICRNAFVIKNCVNWNKTLVTQFYKHGDERVSSEQSPTLNSAPLKDNWYMLVFIFIGTPP